MASKNASMKKQLGAEIQTIEDLRQHYIQSIQQSEWCDVKFGAASVSPEWKRHTKPILSLLENHIFPLDLRLPVDDSARSFVRLLIPNELVSYLVYGLTISPKSTKKWGSDDYMVRTVSYEDHKALSSLTDNKLEHLIPLICIPHTLSVLPNGIRNQMTIPNIDDWGMMEANMSIACPVVFDMIAKSHTLIYILNNRWGKAASNTLMETLRLLARDPWKAETKQKSKGDKYWKPTISILNLEHMKRTKDPLIRQLIELDPSYNVRQLADFTSNALQQQIESLCRNRQRRTSQGMVVPDHKIRSADISVPEESTKSILNPIDVHPKAQTFNPLLIKDAKEGSCHPGQVKDDSKPVDITADGPSSAPRPPAVEIVLDSPAVINETVPIHSSESTIATPPQRPPADMDSKRSQSSESPIASSPLVAEESPRESHVDPPKEKDKDDKNLNHEREGQSTMANATAYIPIDEPVHHDDNDNGNNDGTQPDEKDTDDEPEDTDDEPEKESKSGHPPQSEAVAEKPAVEISGSSDPDIDIHARSESPRPQELDTVATTSTMAATNPAMTNTDESRPIEQEIAIEPGTNVDPLHSHLHRYTPPQQSVNASAEVPNPSLQQLAQSFGYLKNNIRGNHRYKAQARINGNRGRLQPQTHAHLGNLAKANSAAAGVVSPTHQHTSPSAIALARDIRSSVSLGFKRK